MTQQYTPAQLEALLKPYPLKPLVLGANAGMDHYETTVWKDKVDAMRKRRAEAAPDLARLVLEKDAEIARLRAALKPFVDATRLADLRRLENDDVLLKLTWPSKKGHTCFANLGPCQIEAARQAMKGSEQS